ncbi:MAG: hypothetical protein AAGI72_23475 [Pseudomonadota bacterium]
MSDVSYEERYRGLNHAGALEFLKKLARESGNGADGETILWAADRIEHLQSTVSVLQGRLNEVTADLEGAAKDRERLEWMLRTEARVVRLYGNGYAVTWYDEDDDETEYRFPDAGTAEEALELAMQTAQQDGEDRE